MPMIMGQSGSQHHTTSFALVQIGIQLGPANKVMSKLHEHSVLTFRKKSTRKREDRQN